MGSCEHSNESYCFSDIANCCSKSKNYHVLHKNRVAKHRGRWCRAAVFLPKLLMSQATYYLPYFQHEVDLITIETANNFTNLCPYIATLVWKHKCKVAGDGQRVCSVTSEISYQICGILLTTFHNNRAICTI